MSDKVFVDTNVLVYARDTTEQKKHGRAFSVVRDLWEAQSGVISDQVLNEYYVTVTRKLKPGRAPELAREDVRQLQSWQVVSLNASLREMAWNIEVSHKTSYWDSLVVAAAISARCRWLLSEDLQHGMRYQNVEVFNPIANQFEAVQK